MPGIGPTLPPVILSKRKRAEDHDGDSDGSECSAHSTTSNGKRIRITGPLIPGSKHVDPSQAGSRRRGEDITSAEPDSVSTQGTRIVGPSLPSPSQAFNKKASKIVGPSLPPAHILDKPYADDQEDSDSEDDFGPALPSSSNGNASSKGQVMSDTRATISGSPKANRDEWMLAPPKSKDRSSQIDPSKMKTRGFTGGPRTAPMADGDMSLWTESPEEKRKRLEEEVLGVRKVGQSDYKGVDSIRKEEEAARLAKKVKAYNVSNLDNWVDVAWSNKGT